MDRPQLVLPWRAEGSSRRFQVFLCAMLILLWEGVPFAAVGLPTALGMHAVSLLMILGVIAYFNSSHKLDVWVVAPLLFFCAMLFSTIVSSIFFFENPIFSWIKAFSNYSPVFLIFFARSFDIRLSEFLKGLLIATAIAAGLVLIDHFHHLSLMDDYAANSGFSASNRRIILMKNEIAFAFVVSLARLLTSKSPAAVLGYGTLMLLLGFDLIVVTESRILLAAVLIAAAAFVMFGVPLGRKVVVIALSAILIAGAGQVIFGKYIDRMESTSSYTRQDASVAWRLLTVRHYEKYFNESKWVGFGVMSTNPDEKNIITYSYYDASWRYGDKTRSWGLYLADISLLGVLFQFGIPGFLLAIFMSLYGSFKMIGMIRRSYVPHAAEVVALGFMLLFLMVNPWPVNIFGLSWAIMSGNFVWCIAARASLISRAPRRIGARMGVPRIANDRARYRPSYPVV